MKKVGTMVGSSVFQFIDGVTHETFETDDQFRTGRITAMVAGKVKITWTDADGGQRYEYVRKGEITKIERETYILGKVWDGTFSGHEVPLFTNRVISGV